MKITKIMAALAVAIPLVFAGIKIINYDPTIKVKGEGFIFSYQEPTSDELTVTVKNITTGLHYYDVTLMKNGMEIAHDGVETSVRNDKEGRVFFSELDKGTYTVIVQEPHATKPAESEKIKIK